MMGTQLMGMGVIMPVMLKQGIDATPPPPSWLPQWDPGSLFATYTAEMASLPLQRLVMMATLSLEMAAQAPVC
jgi:hypothetical protein